MSNNNQLQKQNQNSMAPMFQQQSSQQMAMVAREAQEVQAAVFMARQFPRDAGRCLQMIEGDCQRTTLAEKGCYEYPKGGQTVSGPSIRLAEVIALRWGNIDTGWKIIDSSKHDETGCMAWAWDLETNTKKRIEFVVKHQIGKRDGSVKIITDERDLYELIANKASRRQRNCILAIIPGDVTEAAVNKCNDTLAKSADINKMRTDVVDDLAKHGVQVAAIEKRIGKKISHMTGIQCVQLRNVVTSLNDGMSSVSDWFDDVLNPEKITKEQKKASEPTKEEKEYKPAGAVDSDREKALMDFDQMCQQYVEKKRNAETELKRVGSSIELVGNLTPDRIRAATKFLGDQLK